MDKNSYEESCEWSQSDRSEDETPTTSDIEFIDDSSDIEVSEDESYSERSEDKRIKN